MKRYLWIAIALLKLGFVLYLVYGVFGEPVQPKTIDLRPFLGVMLMIAGAIVAAVVGVIASVAKVGGWLHRRRCVGPMPSLE